MAFFKVFKAREGLLEILSQKEHLLRHIDNLIVSALTNRNHLRGETRLDIGFLLQLLADFQSHVQASYRQQTRFSATELVVVH